MRPDAATAVPVSMRSQFLLLKPVLLENKSRAEQWLNCCAAEVCLARSLAVCRSILGTRCNFRRVSVRPVSVFSDFFRRSKHKDDPGATSCSGEGQHASFPVTVSDCKCGRIERESTTFVVLVGTSALPANAHKQDCEARGSSGKGRKPQAVLSCRHQSQSNLLHAYQ